MTYEIKVEWEGRYDIYVAGELVGYSKRKWLAKAIAEAIVAGNIEPTGDTTSRYSEWAYTNAPEQFERMGNGY
jgi:hypothetical protein